MEVKQEITEIIESLPTSVLPALLSYLKGVKMASQDEVLKAVHLSTILKEDHELLKELAN